MKQSYKNPSFDIDVHAFLMWHYTSVDSTKELGIIFKEICLAAVNSDTEKLKQFNWITRIYKGTAKRPSVTPSIRKRVLSVGFCAYCNSTENLTIDHIIPFSKGGAHEESNFQCLCWKCNRAKSNKLQEQI